MEIFMHGNNWRLLSVTRSKEDQIAQIQCERLESEHELWLRLLQAVPLDLLPIEIAQAAEAWDKAAQAWSEAWEAWEKAVTARDEAAQAWSEAEESFHDVCARHKDGLEALHKKLCVPDCPWDGQKILLD